MDGVVDVAVVGAGSAGAATALRVLQLHPGARVLLLDAAAFPRDRACGDGIAAQVFDLLESLGVPDLQALAPDVSRLRLRTSSGRVVSRTCARPNRVVPRAIFDATLVAAAVRCGAELRRHRVRRLEIRPDLVLLDGAIAARTVVGADGANSTVRRLRGAPATPAAATAVAIRGYTRTAGDPDAMVIEFARGPYPAYAWSFPLSGGGANVGYGVIDRRGGGSRRTLLDGLCTLLPGQPPEPATVRGHLLPLSTGPRFHPDGLVLLVGDAAAMVNPLTGEGIYDAVASGILAGRAALEGPAAGAAHPRAVRRCFGRHHRHTAALSRLMGHQRFLDAAVAAAAGHRSVFDAAVELGLGRHRPGRRAGPGGRELSQRGPRLTLARSLAPRAQPGGQDDRMPEGDTVWLTARRLDTALAGRPLTRAELRVPQLATTELAGMAVTAVVSRGKHLLTRLNSELTLHSHLRMDGSWRIVRTGRRWTGGPAYSVRAVLGNPEWECVGYRVHDLAVVPTAQESDLVGHLGPDLLGPDWDPAEAVRRLLAEPDREIGQALLDQRTLAGIGNMYKAELLFLRGVHPFTVTGAVTDLSGLVDLAHRVLYRNKDAPEQSTTGSNRRGENYWVYLRAGQPCLRCRTTVAGADQGTPPYQRPAYWCPNCQPAVESAAFRSS